MRIYTENWNYTLASDSQPYGIDNGSPYTSGGLLRMPEGSAVNKDFLGSPYQFGTDNYHGSYALSFDLDMRNSSQMLFCIWNYASNASCPAICYRYDFSGFQLAWSNYNSVIVTARGDATGDFYGQIIPPDVIYKVTFFKRVIENDSSSLVAMAIKSPTGTVYRTGWANTWDSLKRNQIGALNRDTGYGLTLAVGPLTVADELTDAQAIAFLAAGEIDTRPVPLITPLSKTVNRPVTVTLTPPVDLPAGWTLRYTTDGADPQGSSLPAPSHIATSDTRFICSRAPELYVSGNIGGYGETYLVNRSTGVMTSVVSVASVHVPELMTWHNNRIYYVDQTNMRALSWADPNATTPVLTPIGPADRQYIAIESSGTTLYVFLSWLGLYSINTDDASLTLVCSMPDDYPEHMTYLNGIMYMKMTNFSEIRGVDCATGSVTYTWTSSYHRICNDGTKLYALEYTQYNGNNVYSIDPATGVATVIVTNIQSVLSLPSIWDMFDMRVVDSALYLSGLNLAVIGLTPIPPTGTPYVNPFVVGDPLALNTSVTVKAAYASDSTGERAPVASETYSFALTPPVFTSEDGTPRDYIDAFDAVEIHWKDEPTDGTFQILYTLDNSDPATSPTALIWSPGSMLPFNSYPVMPGPGVPSDYQINNPLIAVMKHVASGQVSNSSSIDVWFYFSILFNINIPARANDDVVTGFNYETSNTSPLIHVLTIDGVAAESATPPTISIPFDAQAHTVEARVLTTDRSLYAIGLNQSMSFYQRQPILPKTSVASISASILPVNPNGPNSSLHYTVDGSTPTASSSTVSGPVTVPSNGTLKVIAYRNGVSSDIAKLDVLPEYEVTEVVTSLDDVNYHYHIAAQRTALTSRLGASLIDVTVGSNATPTKVAATVNGEAQQLSLWDSTDAVGAYNVFSGFNWLNAPTLFWSRLSYTAATCAFAWTYPSTLLPTGKTVTLFSISITARICSVTYKYVINTTTRQTSIVRTRTNHGAAPSAEVVTSGAILIADGSNTLTISITTGSISLTDGTGTSTETSGDFVSGMLWSIEGLVNPDAMSGFSDSTPVVIPCVITTTATSGKLRLAPGSIICSRTAVSVQQSTSIDFRDPSSARLLRHSMLTDGSFPVPINPPAIIGFNEALMSTRVDGLFAAALPGVINVEQDFDVEIKLTTDFLALMTYPESNVNQATLPTITLFLADASSQLNDSSDVQTGVSLRMFVPSDRPGAYPVYLELYSSGAAPTRLTLSSNSKQIALKLSGRVGGIALSAVVDGVETSLTTLTPITGTREVRVRRTGSTKHARKQLTDLLSYTANATFSRIRCHDPILIGTDFVLRQVATGFDAVALTVPDNSAYAVWFNPATRAISAEAISFEPSDGRLLVGVIVGVIETRDDNVIWTNTMYATLVKVRTQVDAVLTGGTVIGVGSGLQVANHRVTWKECGYDRNTAVGNLGWNTPLNNLDLRQNRQIVRALEHQRIRVTAARISLG
jgi:hypothetical protein